MGSDKAVRLGKSTLPSLRRARLGEHGLCLCPCRTAAERRIRQTYPAAPATLTRRRSRHFLVFGRSCMEPSSLRVVNIDDQRWVVRTVSRFRTQHAAQEMSLRFFNGA